MSAGEPLGDSLVGSVVRDVIGAFDVEIRTIGADPGRSVPMRRRLLFSDSSRGY